GDWRIGPGPYNIRCGSYQLPGFRPLKSPCQGPYRTHLDLLQGEIAEDLQRRIEDAGLLLQRRGISGHHNIHSWPERKGNSRILYSSPGQAALKLWAAGSIRQNTGQVPVSGLL